MQPFILPHGFIVNMKAYIKCLEVVVLVRIERVAMLYTDLRPGQTCHSKVMYRKEVTYSDGSYEKKSRRRAWLKKWAKVKIPWYTHRLMHRKRVTCELHYSYFHLMTIKSAIPKIEWAIELLYNSVMTRVQNLDETNCISHSTNALGKGMNPIFLPPAMGK